MFSIDEFIISDFSPVLNLAIYYVNMLSFIFACRNHSIKFKYVEELSVFSWNI